MMKHYLALLSFVLFLACNCYSESLPASKEPNGDLQTGINELVAGGAKFDDLLKEAAEADARGIDNSEKIKEAGQLLTTLWSLSQALELKKNDLSLFEELISDRLLYQIRTSGNFRPILDEVMHDFGGALPNNADIQVHVWTGVLPIG